MDNMPHEIVIKSIALIAGSLIAIVQAVKMMHISNDRIFAQVPHLNLYSIE